MILKAIRLNKKLRKGIRKFEFVHVYHDSSQDPTKSILRIDGISGSELYKYLDKHRINPEKYTKKAIVVTIHTNIIEEDVDYLIEAIKKISQEHGKR